MSQYFLDNLTFGNDTFDLHDTEARQMIANNTQNITALSARVTQNANDIDALEETTADLREDLDSVEDRVTVNEGEIDALKTRTTSLEGRMNSAETRLDGHDTDIASLQNRMTAAEEDIDLLETRMLDAETDIDALEDRMDGVEQKNTEQDAAIDDLDDRVTQNTADIVDIKDDIDEIQDDIQDLDDRITASTYEAGIGIYFGQGEHHTNINVDDELLDQINQNTLDIDLLKTRVTNLENRVTTIEGDIVDIKGDIVTIQNDITSIRGDITSIQNDITTIQGNITTINNEITQIQNDIDALDVRITALEAKALPAGGATGQVLKKRSATDYDTMWSDDLHTDYVRKYGALSSFTAPNNLKNYSVSVDNVQDAGNFWNQIRYLVPFQCSYAEADVRPHNGAHTTIREGSTTCKIQAHTDSLEVGPYYIEDIFIGNIGNISVGDGTDPHALTFALDLTTAEKSLLNNIKNYNTRDYTKRKLTIGVPYTSDNSYVTPVEVDFSFTSGIIRAIGVIPKAFINPNTTGDYYDAAVFQLNYDVTNDTVTFNYQYLKGASV